MPFRMTENRAKVQFLTSARMPHLVFQACVATGVTSNTRYYQVAVAEKLARDLGMPLEGLLEELPPVRETSNMLHCPGQVRVGPANTCEDVTRA